jgi:para-aminobenzoate synthetase/4-amino-4-deoxychorismate lyase
MRFDGVRVPLLDRHLRRLERSADYFAIPVDEDRVRRRVETCIRQHDIHTVRMMRLTVDRWGRINLTTKPLEDASDSPWQLVVADERVDSTNRFLYHKTSRRDVYERAAAQADAEGADEAVLVNEKGEVTEGARSNVFVRIDGQFWTPPVSCGLLAGVYREHVLDTVEEAGERILTLEDLQRADGIFCCNGVRGWRPAVLPESALDVAPPASEAA